MGDLYSIFTFDPPHILHFVLSKVPETALKQYLSCDKIYSHLRRSTAGKQRNLCSVKLPLHKTSIVYCLTLKISNPFLV